MGHSIRVYTIAFDSKAYIYGSDVTCKQQQRFSESEYVKINLKISNQKK